MTIIPNIALTNDEYIQIKESSIFNQGGEGIIYRSSRPDTLYKIFVDEISKEPIEMSDNKLKKILELHKRQQEYLVQPLSTVTINGKLVGYEMSYDKDDVPLAIKCMYRKNLIEVLKRTSFFLHSLAEQDITHGDVKSNNILINKKTKQPKFCDIDNMRVGMYQIDLFNDYAADIVDSKFEVDERVDQYLHNLMTIHMLQASKYTYDEILYDLSEGHFEKFYTEEAQETLRTMASQESFKGGYIAPYVKK